jgi:molecular chaperone GrpE
MTEQNESEPDADMNDEIEDEIDDEIKDESEGSLEMDAEMEAALRDATSSLEERQAAKASGNPGGDASGSADKMTIELLSQELQSLKVEFEKGQGEIQETNDKFARLQAEFENFRKRTLKERQDSFQYGHQNLVKDLLSTVDNLDRAIEHGEQSKDGDFQNLLQGVDLVRHDLLGALAKHGVTVIEAAEQAFDPEVHEAMAQVPHPDLPPNSVVQVLQKGYLLRDRMMRPARVVVSKVVEGGDGNAPTGADDSDAGGGHS